ncbi:hypothetical protein L345_08300, partial [Ophiophagus hannah]
MQTTINTPNFAHPPSCGSRETRNTTRTWDTNISWNTSYSFNSGIAFITFFETRKSSTLLPREAFLSVDSLLSWPSFQPHSTIETSNAMRSFRTLNKNVAEKGVGCNSEQRFYAKVVFTFKTSEARHSSHSRETRFPSFSFSSNKALSTFVPWQTFHPYRTYFPWLSWFSSDTRGSCNNISHLWTALALQLYNGDEHRPLEPETTGTYVLFYPGTPVGLGVQGIQMLLVVLGYRSGQWAQETQDSLWIQRDQGSHLFLTEGDNNLLSLGIQVAHCLQKSLVVLLEHHLPSKPGKPGFPRSPFSPGIPGAPLLPLEKIYHLADIALSAVRREAAAYRERLKSSIFRLTEDFKEFESRVDLWKTTKNQHWKELMEELAPGPDKSWEVWKSLKRLRMDTTRYRDTLNKWGYPVASALCDCGGMQTTTHTYTCPLCPDQCTLEDLMAA